MQDVFSQLKEDLHLGWSLIEDDEEFEDAVKKVKFIPENGIRVWWYYKEEAKYAKKHKIDPRSNAEWSGILVIAPDREYRGGEIDGEDAVVIMDRHPCEKCYPTTDWISLVRLIMNKELVEVFANEIKTI